jgi:alpha-ketoglutarate-dependent taurine dioxygenase
VPTVTFRLLFVLIILAHDPRRIVHMAVTEHPTAAWTAQQLRNAFPGTRPASDVKPPTRWRHWPVQRCPSLLQQGLPRHPHSGGDPDRRERAGARRIIDADAL